jgi:hypothetical protein
MKVQTLVSALFRKRPEASFVAYIPAGIVIFFFDLLAFEHSDILGLLLYGFLFLLAALQLKFRTLVGWILLLAAFLFYTITLALHPGTRWNNNWEYTFFLASGLAPVAFLLLFRPRPKAQKG